MTRVEDRDRERPALRLAAAFFTLVLWGPGWAGPAEAESRSKRVDLRAGAGASASQSLGPEDRFVRTGPDRGRIERAKGSWFKVSCSCDCDSDEGCGDCKLNAWGPSIACKKTTCSGACAMQTTEIPREENSSSGISVPPPPRGSKPTKPESQGRNKARREGKRASPAKDAPGFHRQGNRIVAEPGYRILPVGQDGGIVVPQGVPGAQARAQGVHVRCHCGCCGKGHCNASISGSALICEKDDGEKCQRCAIEVDIPLGMSLQEQRSMKAAPR